MGKRKAPQGQTRWFGPPLVALGAGMWGIETIFRVNLQRTFGSDVLVFFEHLVSLLFAVPLLAWNFRKALGLPRQAWGWMLVSAVIGSAFGTVFFTASLGLVNLSVANVLLNLQPLWSVFVARVALGERISKKIGPWALLALASGIALSFESLEATKFQIHNPVGLLLVFGTILCWGTATVAGRALMGYMPLEVAAPSRMVFGTFATLGIVAFNGHFHLMSDQLPLLTHGPILSEYLKLVLIAGFTPVFFYFYGLKYTSAVAGTFCEMSQTIAALLVTWGVMGQALAAHQVLAGVLLIAAVTRISLLQADISK